MIALAPPPAQRRLSLAATLALTVTLCLPQSARADDITVFAAASLKNALDTVAADWQAETGNHVAISYGGSSALARQIQQGAPADIFISAATNWMDVLQTDNLIVTGSRIDLLGNALVLIAHGTAAAPVEIVAGFDLAGMLGDNWLAMALVDAVPAGQYGKEALIKLGVWDSVQGRVAQTENVRAALDLVARGEALLGVVYASDAIAADQAGNTVTVVGTFPAASHTPIIFPAALIAGSAHPAAADFLQALRSGEARAVFVGQGFTMLQPD